MIASVSPGGVLQRLIGPQSSHWPPEVARFFLQLSLSDADRQRIAALSERANEGNLSADEDQELAMYVLLNDFLAIMQSHARTSLKTRSPAA